jgi:hypothetical protein
MFARRMARARWIAVAIWCVLVLLLVGIGVFVLTEPTPG